MFTQKVVNRLSLLYSDQEIQSNGKESASRREPLWMENIKPANAFRSIAPAAPGSPAIEGHLTRDMLVGWSSQPVHSRVLTPAKQPPCCSLAEPAAQHPLNTTSLSFTSDFPRLLQRRSPRQKAAISSSQAAISWLLTFVLLCLPQQPWHALQKSYSSGH